MNGLLAALIGPITDLLKRLIPDANARAEATEEITKLLISNEAAMLDAAKSVMVADAASEGWLTRNARPLVCLWAIGAITVIMIEAMTGGSQNVVNALKAVPSELWNIVLGSTGLYMLLRTGEKVSGDLARTRQPPAPPPAGRQ